MKSSFASVQNNSTSLFCEVRAIFFVSAQYVNLIWVFPCDETLFVVAPIVCVCFLCLVLVLWWCSWYPFQFSYHHAKEEKAGCLTLVVLWQSVFCVCSLWHKQKPPQTSGPTVNIQSTTTDHGLRRDSSWSHQGVLAGGGLINFTGQNFALDSDVVKTNKNV